MPRFRDMDFRTAKKSVKADWLKFTSALVSTRLFIEEENSLRSSYPIICCPPSRPDVMLLEYHFADAGSSDPVDTYMLAI